MKMLPKARNKDIIVQSSGKELMLYDLVINKALILNETSAIIYQACDGATSYEEMERKHMLSVDIINLTLDQLNKENLLDDTQKYTPIFDGLSRRDVIRRIGLATLVALPVIATLTAPAAAQTLSCRADGESCSFNGFRQSDCCDHLRCDDNSTCIPCTGPGIDIATCAGLGCCAPMPISQLCCFQPISQGGPIDTQTCHCR